MKKGLILLLITTLSLFILSGCEGLVPSEGEGEGECETTVVIDGAVVVDGKTYVSGGDHDIIVTFCIPVIGSASAYITDCNGDYSKGNLDCGSEVVLFPNADRTVWTGSGNFGPCGESGCCASYVQVVSGECLADVCIVFPVIVDSIIPDADLEVCASACDCGGCQISLTSTVLTIPCFPDEGLCWDDCSGIAGWSIAVYDQDPYDECCDIPCVEPVYTCTGVDPFCPIECVTDCLDECNEMGYMELAVVFTIWDMVGNENVEGEMIRVDCDSCEVVSMTPISVECVDPLELNLCESQVSP